MATHESDPTRPLGTGEEVFDLLSNPQKAWVYTYCRHHPDATVNDIVSSLDIPKRTVYDYIETLERAGYLSQSNEGRPAEYVAHAVDLRLIEDDAERQITPTLIEAIARSEQDPDIEAYLDRHGLDGLAVALEYAREYQEGTVTHHIMAREQEISPIEAGTILDALRHVVAN